ncbi:amidase [Actinomadura madurae]|uniref:amidase n=1 Tax=Actinomadura madurae TaxID=1993 RepID=UPI0020274D9C|nr:amidase [Actinomadura madurae]URN02986.1 amidase [Actinomadura madurae]
MDDRDTSDPGGRVTRPVTRSLAVVRRLEPRVRAWAHLDGRACLERAGHADREAPGPLTGLVAGVKDLVDTAGMPTSYGSVVYADHRPRADAAVVRLLKDAGGFVLGKTVTTEFALMTPGPTTNPWRETHTPGGSSSGSAAAVACGMADVAVGTQTYGSLIRPASFCGVWAFKPSRGRVPVTGVRPMAPSFDQIGWFARSPALIETVHRAVAGAPPVRPLSAPPRLGFLDVSAWPGLEPEVPASLAALREAAARRGATVVELDLADLLRRAGEAHHTAASSEIAESLRPEVERHGDRLSAPLRGFVAEGARVTPADRAAAHAVLRGLGARLAAALETVDALLLPSAVGEAPRGLASTGDPVFCSPWTAVGFPALNVPGATGATGLPIGAQLVAGPERDDGLLGCAYWLAGER